MAEEDEADGEAPTPPKIKKAEDNAWYLLATLYGVPENFQDEIWARNRRAWNQYFAANLRDEIRTKLIDEKRYSEEELKPLSVEQRQHVEAAFAERKKGSLKSLALPPTGAHIDFSHVQFDRHAFFDGYVFTGCSFRGARFSENADASFEGATFSSEAYFDGTKFFGAACFYRSRFLALTTFNGVTFSGLTNFSHASFSVLTTFSNITHFSCNAQFVCATFSGDAQFDDATFSREALFRGATFCGDACFRHAKFLGSSSFVNAKMKGETSFEGATFERKPPKFFGAKLHEGTVWPAYKVWPRPKNKDEAKEFVRAYERLKLEMDRLKKHEDELDFFALELQSRRVLLGRWGWGLPIALYGLRSDYGRSYTFPFLWLLVVAAIGAMLLVFSDALPLEKSFGLSAANTLNVFGFRKDFFEPAVIVRLPAWLDVMSALQTILGTILLFLFGLGIRNKFRMK